VRPRRPRSPFEPIRVPAGPDGDAVIDLLCKLWGTTREEARKRGEEAMRTRFTLENLEVRPFPPWVPQLMFMNHRGEMDEEAWKGAQERAEAAYVERCAEMGVKP
jgi:truncated hemoglobin YjbI